LLIFITSGLKIINPKNSGWLSVDDGKMEISWEFFRQQPLFQFPIGINPNYGLELSSTFALDGQLPIMSILFHPLSDFLPERFQYVGIYLLISFMFNYYFAKQLFLELKLEKLNSTIASIILSTSPIILDRIIDNSHYGLTSSFLIFIAYLLVLRKDSSLAKWNLLYLFSILIFLYYWPMIFVIHLIFSANRIWTKQESLKIVASQFIFIFFSSFCALYFIGYLGQGVSSKDSGYGLFRATLTSLIDSSSWSRLIPDLPESFGAYEGFAFLGLPTVILLLILVLFNLFGKKSSINSDNSFKILWAASIILYVYSLSNKVAIGSLELFSLKIPSQLEIFTTSFRSTGRFAWPIVHVFFIWVTFKASKLISPKKFTLLLLALLSANILDTYPQLTSQRNIKFSTEYRSNLTDSGWKSIHECYSKIRVYPPTDGEDDFYDFVNLAAENNLAINTGRWGRVNQQAKLEAFDLMHSEFDSGKYREDSFYVFTSTQYVSPELVNYQKNLAKHTLDEDSAFGQLNGYTYIAPNLSKCAGGKDLKSSSQGFGAPKNQIYRGETLAFGKNIDSSKYILIGFSALEDWGVWSVDDSSKINLNTKGVSNFDSINITAMDLAAPSNSFSVFVNDSQIGKCNFSTQFSLCELPFDFKTLETNIVRLTFRPEIIRSPKDLGISDDTRNLGFGLKNISFS
jgi:hypothetical protein